MACIHKNEAIYIFHRKHFVRVTKDKRVSRPQSKCNNVAQK